MAIASGRTSPGSTLTASSASKLAQSLGALPLAQSTHSSASELIEEVALERSSSVFVYDVAAHISFGTNLSRRRNEMVEGAAVVSMQTRPGAGLILLGRLSEGTSKQGPRGSVISAFTTPTGLEAMTEQLVDLPEAATDARLIVQVAAATPTGPSLTISPSLARLSLPLAHLPSDVAVIISATAQESVDLASLAYQVKTQHVIHAFDHSSAARELRELRAPASAAPSYETMIEAFNKHGIDPFTYHGDPNATTVIVTMNSAASLAFRHVLRDTPGLGLLSVRLLRPWDAEALVLALPRSATFVHVVDESHSEEIPGLLVGPVSSAFDGSSVSVKAHPLDDRSLLEVTANSSATAAYLAQIAGPRVDCPAPGGRAKKLTFFAAGESKLNLLPTLVAHQFLANPTVSVRLLTGFDEFAKPGGVARAALLLDSHPAVDGDIPLSLAIPTTGAASHFVAILDATLLKTHNVFDGAMDGGSVLINTSWTAEELVASTAESNLTNVRGRNLHIYSIDAAGIAGRLGSKTADTVEVVLTHLAFLKLYLGRSASPLTLQQLATLAFGPAVDDIPVPDLVLTVWRELTEILLPTPLSDAPAEAHGLASFEFNATSLDSEATADATKAFVGTRSQAVRALLFPEALTPPAPSSEEEYPQVASLRPDLTERTFAVTCSVNRRLTPLEYNRNVFHMEFDTSGTGLKYAVGEALGVHGWNDEQDVLDFCSWYGVDPGMTISIPVPESNGTAHHVRTVFQALQQQVDLFGRPPKSFYGSLSKHAKAKEDRMALHFIASPEGSSTFKKLGEKDTVTFADVLQRYESARPPIEVLCEMIGDIEPRHYSIASSQSAVGDRVDLLIVTVEWSTPSGSPRFGQCTRYLAGLKIGQKVTVSIKPSVMKLPPDNMQPIIMAGLGTGAAPFRAFMQHRAWQAAQGIKSGPLLYYFGSRHRSEEYLYGEEIEAYLADKVLTHAGLAFSRDQPKKVYIQHKMQEDSEMLATMLDSDAKGVFYLCGPTWPVPDVYEALVGALVKYRGRQLEEAGQFLEGLKEEERYVLEVY